MNFDFHPEAETELIEAIGYYEGCDACLGKDFSLEVYAAVRNILHK